MIDKISKLILEKFGKQADDHDIASLKTDLAQILNKPIFTLQRVCDGMFDNVELDSILFFKKYDEKESIIRTRSHIYKNPYIFSEMSNILQNTNIEHFDRSLYVNINQIRKYDSFLLKIYFDDQIDKNSISIEVYFKKISHLKKILGTANDIANDSLYAPMRKAQHN